MGGKKVNFYQILFLSPPGFQTICIIVQIFAVFYLAWVISFLNGSRSGRYLSTRSGSFLKYPICLIYFCQISFWMVSDLLDIRLGSFLNGSRSRKYFSAKSVFFLKYTNLVDISIESDLFCPEWQILDFIR